MGMELISKLSKWVVCPYCGNEDAIIFYEATNKKRKISGMMCSNCNTKEYFGDVENEK